MQIHQVKPNHPGRTGRRVGRGGKRGTTSGRGTKGQKARAGHKIRPAEREVLKRIPKLRGYKFKSFHFSIAVVNLRDIQKTFNAGDTVSPGTLLKAGLVTRVNGKLPKVKILGTGELKKNLSFKDVVFSRPALGKVQRVK